MPKYASDVIGLRIIFELAPLFALDRCRKSLTMTDGDIIILNSFDHDVYAGS